MKTAFTEADSRSFEPTGKVALVGTVNDQGQIHISLLSALQANSPNTMVLGQFSEGESKRHMQRNNRVGFLIMTLDKRFWTGRIQWTGLKKEGPEYEMFNKKPMFRYNTYFGINTVHYFNLLEYSGPEKLPMAKIVAGALLTKMTKNHARKAEGPEALTAFSRKLFNTLGSLSFGGYLDAEGYPVIFPLIQCQAADKGRLAFSINPFKDKILSLPEGSTLAVFGMNLSMENVLVRGRFGGVQNFGGIKLGVLDIDWVYNSMPPLHGQIYPEKPVNPVTGF